MSREDRLLRLLADGCNREILAEIESVDHSLSVTDLAEGLVEDAAALIGADDYEAAVEATRIELHHVRLPKLADAGLVAYDPEANVVDDVARPGADEGRTDEATIDELLSRVPNRRGADEDAVGLIHGRGNVVEHGRWLFDVAESEVFCLYVTTDLIGETCLGHIRDATDRGVDVVLGSRNPEVRDLTRRRLPDVTVWEPQLDWTNDPTAYPTVGRLVLADREKIMLAVLDEPGVEEASQETAMIGEGTANPLVVLVRELLGSRLDHLDYQSEDFKTKLPFEP